MHFQFLPTVSASISKAIGSLTAVQGPLPNRCDKRFGVPSVTVTKLTDDYRK